MDVVAMPQLGETVTEGTITAWVKAVGDAVGLDDALFEVSTEKVDTEVPAAVAGFLRAILVAEGDTVPVGTVVAVITETADEVLDLDGLAGPPTPMAAVARPSRPPSSLELPASVAPVAGEGPGTVRTPAVRRLLHEHSLDPSQVTGSGRDGRITRADVLAAAARADRGDQPNRGPGAAQPSPVANIEVENAEVGDDDVVVDLSRARLATAAHMSHSLATAAHALVAVEVDYASIEPVRRAAGLRYLPFVARAVVDGVREFPNVNASFDGTRLVVHRGVHLGVAVDVDGDALVVPVVRDAQRLRLRPLSDAVAALADQARRHRLPVDSLTGGTFTLTNVGSYGTFVTTPIINQPQVAILSTDGVRMAPVAVRTDDGLPGSEPAWGIAVHPVGNLCLSFDHRAFDGAYAAAFLARVREVLQTRDWAGELGP